MNKGTRCVFDIRKRDKNLMTLNPCKATCKVVMSKPYDLPHPHVVHF